MRKTYTVALTDPEHLYLRTLLKKGQASARTLHRAHMLLLAAEGVTDQAIATFLHLGRATVERTRQKVVAGGLEGALTERPRPGGKRTLDGHQEAFLVALTCSAPPAGRSHWTMQLLADRLVELKQVASISDETVRRTLKKTS